jgi:uncharacterized damage-inducible protein DinB
MHEPFAMLAAYNEWANRRLYGAVAKLSDRDYRADHGAFFGSLHGTLNHLLLADRIWMHRFTDQLQADEALDAVLHEDFSELREARRAEDARIIAYVGALTDAALAGTIRYRSTRAPAEIEQYLAPLLIHFFNHQTHHRGQAHALLTKLAGEAPSFDLLVFQRESGCGLARGAGGDFSAPERRPVRLTRRPRVPVASVWGEVIGYSRAVRAGDLIFVSGTTASGPEGRALYPGDPARQAELILERIGAALRALDAELADVVETRIYLADIADWQAVGRVHGAAFRDACPASTIVEVGPLVAPDLLVEISAIAARG